MSVTGARSRVVTVRTYAEGFIPYRRHRRPPPGAYRVLEVVVAGQLVGTLDPGPDGWVTRVVVPGRRARVTTYATAELAVARIVRSRLARDLGGGGAPHWSKAAARVAES